MNTTISFTTHENPARQGAKKGPCIGYITHNGTLGGDSLAQALAQKTSYNPIQARAFVDALSAVITDGVTSGQIIDLGVFRLGLTLKGTFPAANAPFDPKANRLEVHAVPSKALTEAIRVLAPVNATKMGKPCIDSICTNGHSELSKVVLGKRVVVLGTMIRIDTAQADEGIWLESDAGERLAKAEIVETDSARAICVFAAGSVASGKYRLAVYTRDGGAASGQVAAIRRKVKVVG